MSMTTRRLSLLLLLLALAHASTASAVDLTIGRSTEQHAMDPHFVLLGNNTSTAENIFDRLVFIDPNLKMHQIGRASCRERVYSSV